jgi:hypothetical protein
VSTYQSEYQTFFGTDAGEHLLAWIKERREVCHEKSEEDPTNPEHPAQARAYRELLQHIEIKLGGKQQN